MRLSTILENGTASPIEVKSESATGVHTLMATIKPGLTYKLFQGSSDTYLQHWVVVGNAPVVSFNSDELVDNERIKIIMSVGGSYDREVTPRHGVSKPTTTARNERSKSVGAGSDVGKPPTGLRRFLSAVVSPFIKRSPEANLTSVNSEPNLGLSKTSDSAVRTVNSEPIPEPKEM
jgi:hypothetical protein